MLAHLLLPFLFLIPSLASPTPVDVAVPSTAPSAPPTKGNQQEDDDVCPDYKICGQRGLGYWNTLYTTLNDPNARDKLDLNSAFQNYYKAEVQDTLAPEPALEQTLIEHGLDTEHLDIFTTFSKNPDTGQMRGVFWPYENAFDTNAGVIIAIANFRMWDEAPAKERLSWSEVMYHTWQIAASFADAQAQYGSEPDRPEGGPISNLKHVVQHVVINTETKLVLRTMYGSSGYTINKVDPDPWKKWTEKDTPYFFCALLGTDNVKGTVWLLNDHSVEMGRKTIGEIWTRWDTSSPDIW
ncbi:MAG: hypothetical protein LQ346_005256 [Caloplaca aetnensis]|nr:MAG: hypothetical protein LQ346_005256 [Caloplaca aetnensis]